jgi:hypothetical protein
VPVVRVHDAEVHITDTGAPPERPDAPVVVFGHGFSGVIVDEPRALWASPCDLQGGRFAGNGPGHTEPCGWPKRARGPEGHDLTTPGPNT